MSVDTGGHTLKDIAVRDTRVSDAIDKPTRAMILDILAEEALTAANVHERLETRGIEHTENTVRHHINELRDAGFVDSFASKRAVEARRSTTPRTRSYSRIHSPIELTRGSRRW